VFFWRSFQYVTSTVSGERVRAFVPAPLPPGTRALDLASVQTILAEANQAIGRLDGLTSAFPDLKLFSTPTTYGKRLCSPHESLRYGRETGTLPTNAPSAVPDDANIHFELFRAVSFTRSSGRFDPLTEAQRILLFLAHQLEACKESISDRI
jgi:hypothetical protein